MADKVITSFFFPDEILAVFRELGIKAELFERFHSDFTDPLLVNAPYYWILGAFCRMGADLRPGMATKSVRLRCDNKLFPDGAEYTVANTLFEHLIEKFKESHELKECCRLHGPLEQPRFWIRLKNPRASIFQKSITTDSVVFGDEDPYVEMEFLLDGDGGTDITFVAGFHPVECATIEDIISLYGSQSFWTDKEAVKEFLTNAHFTGARLFSFESFTGARLFSFESFTGARLFSFGPETLGSFGVSYVNQNFQSEAYGILWQMYTLGDAKSKNNRRLCDMYKYIKRLRVIGTGTEPFAEPSE